VRGGGLFEVKVQSRSRALLAFVGTRRFLGLLPEEEIEKKSEKNNTNLILTIRLDFSIFNQTLYSSSK
jgi:ribosomal protein S4